MEYLPEDDEARDHPLVKDHQWKLLIVEDEPHRRLYGAIPPRQKEYFCPDCGSKAWLKDQRWSDQTYRDLKRREKNVELRVKRRRLKCPNPSCQTATFNEKLPELNHNRHLTRDLTAELIGDLRRHGSFTAIAAEYRLNEQTLRNLERDFVREQDNVRREKHTLPLPQQVGIHSVRIAKKDCCLLTNVTSAKLLEIVSSQKSEEIKRTIERLFDRRQFENVELVVMAINEGYREVVNAIFPQARVIVPRFEVEAVFKRNLTKISESVAKEMRLSKERRKLIEDLLRPSPSRLNTQNKQLKVLLQQSEVFQAADELRKRLLELFANPTEQSLTRYRDWTEAVASLFRMEPSSLSFSSIGWEDSILEGLAFRSPNYLAPIERLIDRLRALGPSYSFETLRGRLLYGVGFPSREPSPRADTRFMYDEESYDEEFPEDDGSSVQLVIEYLESEFPPVTPKKYD
jgi:transposase